MYEMLWQSAWATIILFSAFVCFESFRFDKQPLRFIGFIAMVIAILHGFHELGKVAAVFQRFPIDNFVGYEVFLPIGLAVWRQKPLVRRIDGRDGRVQFSGAE